MDVLYFIKGIIIGIVITAPIGPVGALVVQRTINRGRGAGILSGLGASVGDAVYGIIVAFSLTFVSDFLMSHEIWVHIIGGVILLIFGIRVYLSKPRSLEPGKPGRGHFGNFGSALLLTLSNPMVILSILALFAILGITEPADYYRTASMLVAGIFVGCFILWAGLCYFIANLRGRLSERNLVLINKITGILILACGAYAFLSLIKLQQI